MGLYASIGNSVLSIIFLGIIIVLSIDYGIKQGLIVTGIYTLHVFILGLGSYIFPTVMLIRVLVISILAVFSSLFFKEIIKKRIYLISTILGLCYIFETIISLFYYSGRKGEVITTLLVGLIFQIFITFGLSYLIPIMVARLPMARNRKSFSPGQEMSEEGISQGGTSQGGIPQEGISQGEQNTNQLDDSTSRKLKRFFSSPTEKFICTLGNSYIEKFISDGIIAQGFAILSDKRVYFKGKCYNRIGKRITKTLEERIVDVKDVTGTGFVHNKPIWMIIAAVLSLIYFIIYVATERFNGSSDRFINATGVGSLISFISFTITYLIKRRTLFEISFAGGNISFNTSWLGQNEINSFQRNIRLMKDAYSEQFQKNTLGSVEGQGSKPAQESTTADELKKYVDLLEQGILTQEEFEKIKANLLAKLK